MNSFDGRIALVTGAGPNIGRTIAATLAAAGAKGVCNDLVPALAEAAAAAINRAGGKAFALPADISNPQQARELVERANREVGLVDILVNNAGTTIPRSIL